MPHMPKYEVITGHVGVVTVRCLAPDCSWVRTAGLDDHGVVLLSELVGPTLVHDRRHAQADARKAGLKRAGVDCPTCGTSLRPEITGCADIWHAEFVSRTR
jgi:hypothetical protein